jgi:hypothetical protein
VGESMSHDSFAPLPSPPTGCSPQKGFAFHLPDPGRHGHIEASDGEFSHTPLHPLHTRTTTLAATSLIPADMVTSTRSQRVMVSSLTRHSIHSRLAQPRLPPPP